LKIAIIKEVATWLTVKDKNGLPLLKIYQLTIDKT
jgi:hypothetical protein